MARAAQASGTAVAVRPRQPADFKGTPAQWRVLTETVWPSARTAEAIQLAIAYCGARHLDPFKRPVHIVPVWNKALRREVETVWPGINELLTTAARSKAFAGVDEAVNGPVETRTFEGAVDDENNRRHVKVTVTFPVSCSVRVWRHVQGERRPFTVPVYWMETYAHRGFYSELPNAMWEKRPYGQLAKCALAASLRAAFPEDLGSEYAAEEMEGREVESGGVVIDGNVEREEAGDTTTTSEEPGALKLMLLDETNGTIWMKHLRGLADAAASDDEVVQIGGHPSVLAKLARDSKFPKALQEEITELLRKAHERFAPAADQGTDSGDGDTGQTWDGDPIGELLAEVDQMDAITLDGLQTNAAWRAKVKAASSDFPPDEQRLREHIEARVAALKAGGTQ